MPACLLSNVSFAWNYGRPMTANFEFSTLEPGQHLILLTTFAVEARDARIVGGGGNLPPNLEAVGRRPPNFGEGCQYKGEYFYSCLKLGSLPKNGGRNPKVLGFG